MFLCFFGCLFLSGENCVCFFVFFSLFFPQVLKYVVVVNYFNNCVACRLSHESRDMRTLPLQVCRQFVELMGGNVTATESSITCAIRCHTVPGSLQPLPQHIPGRTAPVIVTASQREATRGLVCSLAHRLDCTVASYDSIDEVAAVLPKRRRLPDVIVVEETQLEQLAATLESWTVHQPKKSPDEHEASAALQGRTEREKGVLWFGSPLTVASPPPPAAPSSTESAATTTTAATGSGGDASSPLLPGGLAASVLARARQRSPVVFALQSAQSVVSADEPAAPMAVSMTAAVLTLDSADATSTVAAAAAVTAGESGSAAQLEVSGPAATPAQQQQQRGRSPHRARISPFAALIRDDSAGVLLPSQLMQQQQPQSLQQPQSHADAGTPSTSSSFATPATATTATAASTAGSSGSSGHEGSALLNSASGSSDEMIGGGGVRERIALLVVLVRGIGRSQAYDTHKQRLRVEFEHVALVRLPHTPERLAAAITRKLQPGSGLGFGGLSQDGGVSRSPGSGGAASPLVSPSISMLSLAAAAAGATAAAAAGPGSHFSMRVNSSRPPSAGASAAAMTPPARRGSLSAAAGVGMSARPPSRSAQS